MHFTHSAFVLHSKGEAVLAGLLGWDHQPFSKVSKGLPERPLSWLESFIGRKPELTLKIRFGPRLWCGGSAKGRRLQGCISSFLSSPGFQMDGFGLWLSCPVFGPAWAQLDLDSR